MQISELLYLVLLQAIPIKSCFKNINPKSSQILCPDELTRSRNVIFDAGSTGTRLHLFIVDIDSDLNRPIEPSDLKMQSYSFPKTIALSSIRGASQFPTLRTSLRDLLTKSYENDLIPESCYKNTNVHLYATAGLRLISAALSKSILEEVKSVLMKSHYNLGNESVRIINGQEEGINLWLSVNFFTGAINKHKESKTTGVLDLGGGSTQIVIEKNQTDDKNTYKEENIFTGNLLGMDFNLYAVSYLNAGRSAIRYLMSNKSIENNKTYETYCIKPHSKVKDDFHGDDTFFKGLELHNNDRRYDICKDNATKSREKLQIEKIWSKDQPLPDLHGVSSFFYLRDALSKLENKCEINSENLSCNLHEHSMSISLLKEMAKIYCKNPEEDRAVPRAVAFLCMDLVWVVELLQEGYGIWSENHSIFLQLQNNSHKYDWSAGIALQAGYQYFKKKTIIC